ncbi:TonB-dependent receptor domain-containing protein [Sphingomonas sp.]|uniref:TonB-dependent receptor domain-containing protein n=1 Tax=Sphingomonas sp. TaxID=28214 RepID=UPI0035BC010C
MTLCQAELPRQRRRQPLLQPGTDTQSSVEVRFAGTRIGPSDYQIGGYHFDEFLDVTTQLTSGSTANYQRPKYNTKSYAGFGRLTLNVSNRLRLVGGLRYTEDKKRFSTTQLTAVISCTRPLGPGLGNCPNVPVVPLFNDPSQLGSPFPAAGGAPIMVFVGGVPTGALSIRRDIIVNDRRLSNDKITYRGAVEFDVAPRSLLYASIESGYRWGGFSVATGFETYQPETITAYTVGMKNRFFGNRLQANVEGFIWKYRNQQVSRVAPDLATPPNNANYVQNIGSSTIQGFEIDGKLLIMPTTLVGANLQYLDTEQKDYAFAAAINPPPITGCPVTPATATQVRIDCSGYPSYNSPKWTLNLSGQQTIKLDGFQVVLSADTQHRSSRYIGFAYLPQQLIGSTWTSNAQIQLGPDSERWSVAAYVRNIENDRIPIYSIVGSGNFLTYGATAPRTYGLRLSAKY